MHGLLLEWRAFAELFHRFLLTRGYTLETARGYVWHTHVFWQWATEREVSPLEATTPMVERFIVEQLETLSSQTAYNRLMALRAFGVYCIAAGYMAGNPTLGLKVKKPKRQPVQPFSVAEMKRLLLACDSLRDRAIILTLADTGVRIGELLKLRAQDINWSDGTVRIAGKGKKERWVAVGADTLAALKQAAGTTRAGVIWHTQRGTELTAQQCRKNLCAVAVRAGVARTFPHRFRSTFANEFLEAGGDLGALQAVMGHSDIAMTSFYAGYTRAKRGLDQMRSLNLASKLLN